MSYLTLVDEEGIVHVMWCGLIDAAQIEIWQCTTTLRWCACQDHVMGLVTFVERTPTCLLCIGHFHEHATSRYGRS